MIKRGENANIAQISLGETRTMLNVPPSIQLDFSS